MVFIRNATLAALTAVPGSGCNVITNCRSTGERSTKEQLVDVQQGPFHCVLLCSLHTSMRSQCLMLDRVALCAGRRDVANAVVRFGGFRKVACQLDLKWRSCSGTSAAVATTLVAPADTHHSKHHATSTEACLPSDHKESVHSLSAISSLPRPLSTSASFAALEPGSSGRLRQRHALQGSKQVSPALAEAAAEMRTFMAHRSLEYLPTRAQLQDAGVPRCMAV